MQFDPKLAEKVAKAAVPEVSGLSSTEADLVQSFVQVCSFLSQNPQSLSWRGRNVPDLGTQSGLEVLAQKYFAGYRASDFPGLPGTVPDAMVSEVMQAAYGYSAAECERIKLEHQHAMCAENCVGALLERYLDSVLRAYGWHWCCGDFVRAVDFLRPLPAGGWELLQIKNRDNSENSSSSAIRQGTLIQKWFRTYSRTGATNWANLPASMQGLGLSEDGFVQFVRRYLAKERQRLVAAQNSAV